MWMLPNRGSRFLQAVTALLVTAAFSNMSVNGYSFLNDRITTSFDSAEEVQLILNLALDAAAMKESQDATEKANIYENGISGSSTTLQSLSLDAKTYQAENPYYNMFRHAFLLLGSETEGEQEGSFDGQPIENYGDTIVQDLFELKLENIETDAALIMNVWMSAINELFLMLHHCKESQKDLSLSYLDRTMAFYIGEGQVSGSNDRGHLLYRHAEVAGSYFDQDNGETVVNTRVIAVFKSIQDSISTDTCSDATGYETVRGFVKQLVSLFTIPLVQMLTHYILNVGNEGGSSFVELYSLGLLPRVAMCNPSLYRDQLDITVLHRLSTTNKEEALSLLQQSFSCLEITCEDVGMYEGGTVGCTTSDLEGTEYVLAGYSTDRSSARLKSYIDRDILQMEAFMKFKAFGIAQDWYEYGWNSVYNFRELARNEITPTMANGAVNLYSDYYGDLDFAHQTISNAFQGLGQFVDATAEQVSSIILGTLRLVVVFVNTVAAAEYAVVQCDNGQTIAAKESWDLAAMIYLGSMEGKDGLGNNGQMLYAASNSVCGDLDTCVEYTRSDGTIVDVAISNEDVLDAFSNGPSLLDDASCDVLSDVVEDLLIPSMITTQFQGIVKYASINKDLAAGTKETSLATGSAYSSSILPILDDGNQESADTIKFAMQFQLLTKPIATGFSSVATALRVALPDLAWDIQCDDIGYLDAEGDDGDFCLDDLDATPVGIPDATPVASPVEPSPVEPSPVAPPPVASPVETPVSSPATLAFSRFKFSSEAVADGDSSFGLDVRDMRLATTSDAAKSIYENGFNANTKDLSGSPGIVSLMSYSALANSFMQDNPMFNIYKYANYDDQELGSQQMSFAYADEILQNMFERQVGNDIIAEGTVVLNSFMAIVNSLYDAVIACEKGLSMTAYIDSAVAMWIGKGQEEGKFGSGWMMYSIGQDAYENFGYSEAESPFNTQFMKLMLECQAIVEICADPAADSAIAAKELRVLVQQSVRTLSKPLAQNLLFAASAPNLEDLVELYVEALVPQAAACDPNLKDYLETALVADYDGSGNLSKQTMVQLASFFRCIRVTCEDLKVSEGNVGNELSTVVHGICGLLNEKTLIAGYKTVNEDVEAARLDLDARTIEVLMATKAYKAATDIYTLGWNALADKSGKTVLSLQDVATSDGLQPLRHYQDAVKYHGTAYYADSIIMETLNGQAFTDLSETQRQQVVLTALKGMVMYLGIMEKLEATLDNCSGADDPASSSRAEQAWDEMVAMYVGSMEGPNSGGRQDGEGLFLYGLGNSLCEKFRACEAGGESLGNQELLLSFVNGLDALRDGNCDEVKRSILWDIIPRITLPLVQGVLAYAVDNEGLSDGVDQDGIAVGTVLAESLLPYIDSVNATSSKTIEDNFSLDPNAKPVPDGAAKIFDAVSFILRKLGIDCEDVGSPSADLSVCNEVEIAPHADTPTNLGDDLYITTTYVQDRANIALDIRDMEQSLVAAGNRDIALLVYKNGKNSELYDENGRYNGLRSLRSLSTESTVEMLDEPLFNMFMYALQDDKGQVQGQEARLYADSIVERTFSMTEGTDSLLPAEAAVALNLWMFVAHSLERTLENCRDKSIRDDDGVHSIDVAVAYWIGDGDFSTEGDNGHVLYEFAEEIDQNFSHDKATVSGQSLTNTNILRLFNQAKNELNMPGACSDNPSTFTRLRHIFNKIFSVMAIPLAQGLIHNLLVNDKERVMVYAHAFVPLVASCSGKKFAYLKDKLLTKDQFNVVEVNDIVTMIRSSLSCVGLSCDDVGQHVTEVEGFSAYCDDDGQLANLAGYKPTNDVRDYALFDLDLLELDLLLKMKAYTAALDIYLYGKHVDNPNEDGASLSLSRLASSSDRTVVPTFDTFSRYYESDNFADKIVKEILDDSSKSDEERRVIAVRVSQSMILYFGVLQLVFEAIADCSKESGSASESWDRAAALLIGHLEGTQEGGTNEGYMIFDMAQEYCSEFGTCEKDQTRAAVADQFISLLYAGRGALQSGSCKALRKEASELSSLILVPIIQGTLSSALKVSSSGSNTVEARAEGNAFSLALLPLVNEANRNAAKTLSDNLGPDASPSKNTAAQVFSALAKSYERLGVNCKLIGTAKGFDACTGVGNRGLSPAYMGIVVGAVVLLLCGCGICIRSRRNKSETLPENNPEFVVKPEGEMNHSMDLLTKAFTDKPTGNGRPPTEMDRLTEEQSPPDEDGGDDDDDDEKLEQAPSIDII